MKVKTAIVTTLVDAEKVLDTFLRYHLHAGFDHIYLFFDDPTDRSIELARAYEKVTIVVRDEELMERWRKTRVYELYAQYKDYISKELIARQILNMEVACELAKQDNIDWILHIDVDEVFHSPRETVNEHFTRLTRRNIWSVHYLNYEAIPESVDIENYFHEVTLFKKNPDHNNLFERMRFSKTYAKNHFNFYRNGKSAAQVKRILLSGVHDFTIERHPASNSFSIKSVVNAIIAPLRRLNWFKGRPSFNEPVILHYSVCGFDRFWNKYVRLGDFSNKVFDVGAIQHPLHIEARDVVASDDKIVALALYKKRVMLDDIVADLQRVRLVIRIDDVARITRAW